MAFRFIITSTIACLFFLSSPEMAQPQGDCSPPELETFLEASRVMLHFEGAFFPSPAAETLCLTIQGQRLKWLGVRWYGPEDGALFVLGDNDRRIAVLPIGSVQHLREGPRLLGAEIETVWVDYVASHGTGYLLLETALVTLSGEKIITLWRHTTFERNFVLREGEWTEEVYDVTDNKNGTITVNGTLKTFTPGKMGVESEPLSSKKLKEENYCWLEIIGGFTPCGKK